ncbi:hypothetical protein [Blastococcus sp. SYSU D01042]
MKHALVAYGTLLVVLLAVARQYEAAGPDGVDALDLATALVDAVLVLAVAAGILLAGRLGLERWALSMARWRRARALEQAELPDAEVIGVTSWRPGTPPPPPAPVVVEPAVRPAPKSSAGFTYVGPSYAREVPAAPPFPDRRGRSI